MRNLIVRSGGLGDAILTMPVAWYMKSRYPGAELSVLGIENVLAVARLSGFFTGYHSGDTAGFASLYSGAAPSDFLRSFFSSFDEVIFFTAGDRESILRTVLSAGADRCRLLDPRPFPDQIHHITEHLMSVFEGDGISSVDFFPSMIAAARKQEGATRSGIVIHPGSGSREKNWPLEHFITVARKSISPVTFISGPAEQERGMDRVLSQEGFGVTRPESFQELASILSEAELYLGNDSGVSHLAAFVETPSIVLFGPTDPRVWHPLGEWVIVMSSPDRTMRGIGVNDVLSMMKTSGV